jgi:hypothetical protein
MAGQKHKTAEWATVGPQSRLPTYVYPVLGPFDFLCQDVASFKTYQATLPVRSAEYLFRRRNNRIQYVGLLANAAALAATTCAARKHRRWLPIRSPCETPDEPEFKAQQQQRTAGANRDAIRSRTKCMPQIRAQQRATRVNFPSSGAVEFPDETPVEPRSLCEKPMAGHADFASILEGFSRNLNALGPTLRA